MQQQTAESKSTGGRRQTLPPALLECLKATAPPRAAEACALEELKEHITFDWKKLLKRGLKMGAALNESCPHFEEPAAADDECASGVFLEAPTSLVDFFALTP